MFIYKQIKQQWKLYKFQNTPEKTAYDVHKFPKSTLDFLIYSAAIVWAISLIFLIYYQYQAQIKSHFISLDVTAGVCVQVATTVTGSFYADESGNWNTNLSFTFNRARYGARLTNLQFTDTQWTQAFSEITKKIKWATRNSLKRDFAWNTVLWSSWSSTIEYADSVSAREAFSTTASGRLNVYAQAEPQYIFSEAAVTTAGFSNNKGVCLNRTMTGNFNPALKTVDLNIPLCENGLCQDDSDEYCPGLFYPIQFGYKKRTAGSRSMKVSFDVRTLTTALAVNMQLLNVSDLEIDDRNEKFQKRIKNLVDSNFLTFEDSYYIQPYYDPNYSPMDSVYCIVKPAIKPETAPTVSSDDDLASFGNTVSDSKTIVLYFSQMLYNVNATVASLLNTDERIMTLNQNYTAIAVSNAFRNPLFTNQKYRSTEISGPFVYSPVEITDIFDPTLSEYSAVRFNPQFYTDVDPTDPTTVEIVFSLRYNFTDQYKKSVYSNDQAVSQVIDIITNNLKSISSFLRDPPGATTASQEKNLFSEIDDLSISDSYFGGYNDIDFSGTNDDYQIESGDDIPSSATCDCDNIINSNSYCYNEDGSSTICTCSLLESNYGFSCSTSSPTFCKCPIADSCLYNIPYDPFAGQTCTSIINQDIENQEKSCFDMSGKAFTCTCGILNWMSETLYDITDLCADCNCGSNTTLPSDFDTCMFNYYYNYETNEYSTCRAMQYSDPNNPLTCDELYAKYSLQYYYCWGCQECSTFSDDENVDDENGDGENGDGENGDGENGDGENGDGENGDGENGDGENGDGENGDGENGDGENGDGENGDGENGDGENGDGENGDGENGDGENGDGENGDGENGDGENGDGEIPTYISRQIRGGERNIERLDVRQKIATKSFDVDSSSNNNRKKLLVNFHMKNKKLATSYSSNNLESMAESLSSSPKKNKYTPKPEDSAICLMLIGDTFMIPVTTSVGQKDETRSNNFEDPFKPLPKPCQSGINDINCYKLDSHFGFVYFLPKKKDGVIKPDGQFYKFAVDLLFAANESDIPTDIYYGNISYDALSLSAHIEQARLKVDSEASVLDHSWASYGTKDGESKFAWSSSFNDLCSSKCNLLSFRLFSDSMRPVLNQFSYSTEKSLAYNNTLTNDDAFKQMSRQYPQQLTEKYYDCTITPSTALLNSIGVSFTNSRIIGVIYTAFLIALIANILMRYDSKKYHFNSPYEDHIESVKREMIAQQERLDIMQSIIKTSSDSATIDRALASSKLARTTLTELENKYIDLHHFFEENAKNTHNIKKVGIDNDEIEAN